MNQLDSPSWLGFLTRGRVPLWLKLLVTLWVVVLIPDYWRASPLMFLWFCDAALLVTTLGLWLESSFLISMAAVGSVWWMLLWVLDFLVHLVAGVKVTPMPLGMANYMFDPGFSTFSRALSLYHGWLPFVLLGAVRRLGYDPSALPAQTGFAWILLILSYALTADLRGPAGNLNLVYGLSPTDPQHWMAPGLWLVLVMIFCPVCWYVPTHLVLGRLFRRAEHRRLGRAF